jgi:small-conductance mechanosensitive channel
VNTDLEIKLLKDTVLALREEMERARFAENEHIQQAVAGANDEIRQLRASIVQLRELIEQKEAEHDKRVRSIELMHHREKADLHKTIAVLRETLEEMNETLKKTGGPAASATSAVSH